MAYKLKYHTRAKAEKEYLCSTYGQNFAKDFENWLTLHVSEAEKKAFNASMDALDVLNQIDRLAETKWCSQVKRFQDATVLEKMKAIAVVLTKWCPPWELRYAHSYFKLLDRIDAEIEVFFFVDHVKQRVIFTKIDFAQD